MDAIIIINHNAASSTNHENNPPCKAMQRTLFNFKFYVRKQYYHAFLSSKHVYSSTMSFHSDHHDHDHGHDHCNELFSFFNQAEEAPDISLFRAFEMLNSGSIRPSAYFLVHLVRAVTKQNLFPFCGLHLHGYIIKSGFGSNVFVANSMMTFYVKSKSLGDAYHMFVEMPERNVVTWNTLISGYVHSGQFRHALGLFVQLNGSETSVVADAFSFTAALTVCGQLSLLWLGRSVHCKIIKRGLECSIFVSNCLIDMYGKCGLVEEAMLVFDEMVEKDTITWNSVIAGCARNNELEHAFVFLQRMPSPDTISYNEIIHGIAQYGQIEDAVQFLFNMPEPNSSSWNSIITGCVNRNQARQGLDVFIRMKSESVRMDEYTLSSMLSGVAAEAALTWGMVIQCLAVKWGLDSSLIVGSALINMYCKCGKMMDAEAVFRSLPERNLITWNTIISGLAHNGFSAEVFQLFEQLQTLKDVKPDAITFLNVFSACSNCYAPLAIATQLFESMVNDYGIEPTAEHCCTMIRLMGQSGEAWRAGRMIFNHSFGSWGSIWRALLGACGESKDLKIAKVAAAKVLQLEGDVDFVYITLSNICAYHGKWRDVSTIRKQVILRVMKGAGCSWIESCRATPVQP